MDVTTCILGRRTHKHFTGSPVPHEQLETLLELATWAPNHRLTEPWRFFVVEATAMPALTEAVLGTISDDSHPKLLRKRELLKQQLPTLGAFLAVARTKVPDDDLADREDYAACCCAVQNILLGATAMGYGSFWSSAKVFNRPAVREFLGIPDGLELVASIWLGEPADQVSSKRTNVAELTTWRSG